MSGRRSLHIGVTWTKKSSMDSSPADRRYQWFAFLLILALIGASVYLFTIGQDVIAFLLALTTAASVVVRALLAMVGSNDSGDEENSSDGKPSAS